MNLHEMTDRNAPPSKPGRTPKVSETAFSTWLNRGLHDLYDEVAKEPIPDELLRLIRDDENEKK